MTAAYRPPVLQCLSRPLGPRQKLCVAVVAADQLHADWQPQRTAAGRQGDAGYAQQRPVAVKEGVAGAVDSLWRLTRCARRQQDIDTLEQGRKYRAALSRMVHGCIVRCARRVPML